MGDMGDKGDKGDTIGDLTPEELQILKLKTHFIFISNKIGTLPWSMTGILYGSP